MPIFFSALSRTARSLSFVLVGVLSTLGALALTHLGPVQAQGANDRVGSLERQLDIANTAIAALQAKTAPISVTGTDLTITGVNVHLVSGSGSTSDGTTDADGSPNPGKSLTGLGNLVIGYNAQAPRKGVGLMGSHNLILGDGNSDTSFGGLVAGRNNTGSGFYASVSGGMNNTASGFSASVSGGENNAATGLETSVTGGAGNTASGLYASVSGGQGNKASGGIASVSGGRGNKAFSQYGSVSGGKGLTLSAGFDNGWAGGSEGSTPVHGNFTSP